MLFTLTQIINNRFTLKYWIDQKLKMNLISCTKLQIMKDFELFSSLECARSCKFFLIYRNINSLSKQWCATQKYQYQIWYTTSVTLRKQSCFQLIRIDVINQQFEANCEAWCSCLYLTLIIVWITIHVILKSVNDKPLISNFPAHVIDIILVIESLIWFTKYY